MTYFELDLEALDRNPNGASSRHVAWLPWYLHVSQRKKYMSMNLFSLDFRVTIWS